MAIASNKRLQKTLDMRNALHTQAKINTWQYISTPLFTQVLAATNKYGLISLTYEILLQQATQSKRLNCTGWQVDVGPVSDSDKWTSGQIF